MANKNYTTTTKKVATKRKVEDIGLSLDDDLDENECDSCGEDESNKKLKIDSNQTKITQFFTSGSSTLSSPSSGTTKKSKSKKPVQTLPKADPKEDDKFVNNFNSSKEQKLENIKIGAHMSVGNGISTLIGRAVYCGFKAIAFFTNPPRAWKHQKLKDGEANRFKEECKKHNFSTKFIMPHGSYFLNLGSPESDKLQKSRDLLVHELNICEQLSIPLYNFHPGSHLNLISESESLKVVSESINYAINKTKDVILVIECTAGQGTNLGHKFEHIRDIIEGVVNKDRVGVCLDTCHMFAAGYDLTTKTSCQRVFEQFDQIVGFKYLKGIHLNDSKTDLGSLKDRHENIDKGCIGNRCFRFIVNDSRFQNMPMILETAGNHINETKQLYSYIEDDLNEKNNR